MDPYQPQKEPPATLPKPNQARSSTTTMKLRVNFPDIEEGVQSGPGPLLSNGTGTEEARRGSLLLEGVMKAMRGPATYEAEEDDCYPEGATPWNFLDKEHRRDSIEHTRTKLAHKGTTGAGKAKLQRDRKKLREHRLQRAAESGYQEDRPVDDAEFEEEVAEQTKKNTEYNEYLHPLMRSVANAEKLLADHYPDLRSSQGSTLLPYTDQLPSSSSQYSYSTVSDETSDSSLEPNPRAQPAANPSTSAAHAVLDELDKELTALVQGLGDVEF